MSDPMRQRKAVFTHGAQRVESGRRQRLVAGAVLSAMCLAELPTALATPSEPIDPATILTTERPRQGQCVEEVRMQRRIGLGIAGASIFGGTYMISVFAGTLGASYMYIPIVGPVIQAVQDRSNSGFTYLAVLDGLAQAGGLAMMIAGFATKTRTLVYRDTQVSLAPYAGPGGAGLFAVGRF